MQRAASIRAVRPVAVVCDTSAELEPRLVLALQAWQLMMMLPTNRAMRLRLAALATMPAETPPDWPSLE